MKRLLATLLVVLVGTLACRMLCGQSELKKLNDELVRISAKLTPSLVVIEVVGQPAVLVAPEVAPDAAIDRDGPEAIVRALEGMNASVRASGVIMTADGFILTAGEFFRGKGEVKPKVTLADGRTFEGRLVERDGRTGLAVVKIDAQALVPVTLAEKSPPVGSLVIAMGNPGGLDGSISLGVVSGANREVVGEGPAPVGGSTQYTGLLQLTNPLSPGDIGGLAADVEGKMVGMLHSTMTGRSRLALPREQGQGMGFQIFDMGLAGAPTVQGVSFATPAEVIRRVFEPLRKGEKVKWGYMGLYFEVVKGTGLRVKQVLEGAPAAAAGLKEGDIIRSMTTPGGKTLPFTGEPAEAGVFARAVGWSAPGSEVALAVVHDGEARQMKVTLATAPEMPEQDVIVFDHRMDFPVIGAPEFIIEQPWLGVQLNAAPDGARITAVVPTSPAELHGLQVDDVVTRVGERKIDTPETLIGEIGKHKPGDRVSMTLKRGNDEIVADVELGRQPTRSRPIRGGLRADGRYGAALMGMEAKNAEGGALVTNVTPGSPAEKAGLRKDDLIIRVDGRNVAGVSDLRDITRRPRPDDEIKMTVLRGKEELELTLKRARGQQ